VKETRERAAKRAVCRDAEGERELEEAVEDEERRSLARSLAVTPRTPRQSAPCPRSRSLLSLSLSLSLSSQLSP
jgi:hypothetical protein